MCHIKSIYINNFRCLQNFDLKFDNRTEFLFLAKNGMGKSTVLSLFRILRKIALGETDVNKLFSALDFAFGNKVAPIRVKVEFASENARLEYSFVIGISKAGELSVEDEVLARGMLTIFDRKSSNIFAEDRLMLPLVNAARDICRQIIDWVLLMPIPSLMQDGSQVARKLNFDGSNFVSWLKRLLGENPASYDDLYQELKVSLKDFESFKWNDSIEEPDDNFYLTFKSGDTPACTIPFGALSDGEKISVLGAALVVLSKIKPGFLCFWDEPDNYLAASEVHGFITRLRKYLRIRECRLILTSHNLETIRTVGVDSTIILHRGSHQEPTRLMMCADRIRTDAERERYIQDVLSGELYVD